uniref:Uncharacterized protein n=1 Tax=Kalanchoe fedtschenkoi TaxID=63787 RepID=A0A7N0V0N8_KALFE
MVEVDFFARRQTRVERCKFRMHLDKLGEFQKVQHILVQYVVVAPQLFLSNHTITSTPIVITTITVKSGISIHMISYTSFKDFHFEKALISCTSVVSIIISTINFSHNDIYTT